MWALVVLLCIVVYTGQVHAGLYLSANHRNNLDSRNIQSSKNIQMALHAIERKLQHFENAACSTALNGKVDQCAQKIDSIEQQMTRLESFVRVELGKMAGNISSKIVNDDIDADRTLRKIDSIYERINQKLIGIETQVELNSIKIQNVRDLLMSKLEKMEESMTIRDADMEAEITDAVAAIDDLKASYLNNEETIFNSTKDLFKTLTKTNEKTSRKHQLHLTAMLDEMQQNITETLHGAHAKTVQVVNMTGLDMINKTRDKMEENLNEYANKMTNIYEDLLKKHENMHEHLEMMATIGNQTRTEQQNTLRALMIEVGRKNGKGDEQGDLPMNNQKLAELSEKMDANFDSVMMAQNMFLENCHRIQMDEPQLESKISEVLEKLIDTFEKMSLVKTSDVDALRKSLSSHDTTTKHKIHFFEQNIMSLLQQNAKNTEKILNTIQLEKNLYGDLHQLIENKTENVVKKILNQLEELRENKNSSQSTPIFEHIKNIQNILASIDSKINKSYLDYYFNKYNIEFVTHRFGKQLHQYLHAIDLNQTDDFHKFIDDTNNRTTNELILQIFGYGSNVSGVKPTKNLTLEEFCNKTFHPDINVRLNDFDENSFGFSTSDCDQLYNTSYFQSNDEIKNQTTAKPYYADIIDVRFGGDTANATENLENIWKLTTTEPATNRSTIMDRFEFVSHFESTTNANSSELLNTANTAPSLDNESTTLAADSDVEDTSTPSYDDLINLFEWGMTKRDENNFSPSPTVINVNLTDKLETTTTTATID